jgi:raffinose/stachyose/melibiose transport system substrate-binding protein
MEEQMKKNVMKVLSLMILLVLFVTACAAPEETSAPVEETEAPAQAETETEAVTEAETEAETEAVTEAEPVTITYYSTSAEVNAMFEEMFAEYHELNPNVTIELIPTGVGEGQQEKLQSMYASGNAPTFMNIDPANVLQYKEYLLPLTMESAPWLELLNDGAIDAGIFDGEILGIPWSVQGYGLLYNKRIVNEVFGDDFDPSSINTREALASFFEELEAAGYPATMFHGVNWSLGSHYLGLTYAVHGPDTSDGIEFIESLKSGEADIAEDEIFQGYMDTFDLIAEYNYRKDDPLVGDYNADIQDFAQGEVATWFMGDWSWTVIGELEEKDTEFGVLPVPWSNDPEDYGNSQVAVSMPKLQAIDASQSTPEQQQAAIDALEWMLTSPEGQEYFIGQGFYMPYKNVREAEYNSMTTSIAEYMAEGKTINLGSFVLLDGAYWTNVGDMMLQYLDGRISRDDLAQMINEYWQSVE